MDPIVSVIARRLDLPEGRVAATVKLLAEGATIPFISRYRKEATGGLDEVAVGAIEAERHRLGELEERKRTILTAIEGQGALTVGLRGRIAACFDAAELEDLYLPYKPHRHTRADIARSRGLELLADLLLAGRDDTDPRRFVRGEVTDAEAALQGRCSDGSMVYERHGDGSYDNDKHWWVQAEQVVGLAYLYKFHGYGKALGMAVETWEYIKNNLVDREGGEWYWSRKADGSINRTDDKAGFWKCPYHNSRMCLETYSVLGE